MGEVGHRAPYGMISSDWRRDRGAVDWELSVPPAARTGSATGVPGGGNSARGQAGQGQRIRAGARILQHPRQPMTRLSSQS